MSSLHRAVKSAGLPVVLSAAIAVALAGCTAAGPVDREPASQEAPTVVSPSTVAVAPPPAGAVFDYQLGGGYEPPAGVTVVERDRTEKPAGKGYDICYVNGFQTQPGESAAFAREHPDLVVRKEGAPVIDPGWPDEFILDTSTAKKRQQLAAIVGAWITGCKGAGYEAVEIDNLDSYLRSQGVVTASDNIALASEYARIAHQAGLAIAQKNTAEHTAELRAAGFDFAVTESCVEFDECSSYTHVYRTVLDVEYTDELGRDGFRKACSGTTHPPSMILRDPKLVTPQQAGYTYETCGS